VFFYSEFSQISEQLEKIGFRLTKMEKGVVYGEIGVEKIGMLADIKSLNCISPVELFLVSDRTELFCE
jgi:hypothetical protein